jgi:hypothetical protein
MTLPASGSISLNAITAEFGLSADTAFPAGFYGLGGAPSSGPISFQTFYGRSKPGGFTLSATATNLRLATYGGSRTATITSTVATTFSFSGTTALCSAGQSNTTTALVTLTTPGGGNGSASGVVRVTATNGEYVDITFSADWGTA